jgi:hypothetical protein
MAFILGGYHNGRRSNKLLYVFLSGDELICSDRFHSTFLAGHIVDRLNIFWHCVTNLRSTTKYF